MAQTKINLNSTINPSLQVGDMAYVSNILSGGVTSEPVQAGIVLEIQNSYIIVDKDMGDEPIVDSGMFLLFSKRTEVNDSSMKGYYADITFKNHSNKSVELFAISSEISPSSK